MSLVYSGGCRCDQHFWIDAEIQREYVEEAPNTAWNCSTHLAKKFFICSSLASSPWWLRNILWPFSVISVVDDFGFSERSWFEIDIQPHLNSAALFFFCWKWRTIFFALKSSYLDFIAKKWNLTSFWVFTWEYNIKN